MKLSSSNWITTLVAAAAAVSALSCGGTTKTDEDPTEQPPVDAGSDPPPENGPAYRCPDGSDPLDPTALIDDMEDGDSSLVFVNGRTGGWWVAGDETLGATVTPPVGSPASPDPIAGGRCDSQLAMRITGQGFLEWGAGLGLSLAYGTRPNGEPGGVSYDASARQGVEFWARIGDTSVDQVRFAISDSNSEPDGGVCVVDGGVGEQCYDSFGVVIRDLDTEWQRYRIPFAGLEQRDFGVPSGGLVTSAVYTLGFYFDTGAIFDLWVDDLTFY